MKWPFKIIPWLFVALFATEIIAVLLPKKEGEFHVREFGRLPVLLNGRIQPFDTMGRNALLQIRSTGDLPLEQVPSWEFWHHPKKLKSTPWLLEVMTRPDIADTRPIFLIHNPDLLEDLKLQNKGIDKSGLRYYTYKELEPALAEIGEQAKQASQVEAQNQTVFQKQVSKLANALMIYQRLKVTLQPEGVHDFAAELDAFQKDLPAAQKAAQASEAGKEFNKDAIRRMAQPISQFRLMSQYGYALIVPPLHPEAGRDAWQNVGSALLDAFRDGTVHPALKYLATIATAYHQENAGSFNTAVSEYRTWLQPEFSKELRKGRAEFFYNDFKAFLHAMIIYLFAFILAGAALLTYSIAPALSESLRRSAFYLVILAGVVHTFGLVFRMVLEGRPPVTNLYSSAIFIGWAAMVLGIILERIYRLGIGVVMSSLVGFITLMIAHNLALGGDTMEMLRAVLDTNFWLATHVVVVTLGYASTFAAGLLAIIYIFLGLFTPLLSQKVAPATASGPGPSRAPGKSAAKTPAKVEAQPEIGKALSKMVYGIVCFATLFSFVGTVLGGIWADQSWGRFWGWDPKENGALLIVLWNAIILHARWGGLVRERGIMNLAVFGNVVTSFSWFGVNMLGVGLHVYGFTDAQFNWLISFIALQLAIIGMGMLPLRFWRSFRSRALATKKPAQGGARAVQPATT